MEMKNAIAFFVFRTGVNNAQDVCEALNFAG
jgi:hypothetical protein